jgi:DNA polymerase I
MKGTLLLIDANSLIHRAYHALPPLTSKDGKPAGALFGLSSILLKILKEGLNGSRPKYVIAAFDTPEPTFRDKEYKDYKATRQKTADDLVFQLGEAQKLFEAFEIEVIELPGWEADDLIATLASRFKDDSEIEKVIIFSGDLDALQVVGDKVTAIVPQKGITNIVTYNEEAVFKRFGVRPSLMADYKGLVGDKSDNIPGVPGIGPKTASNLIDRFNSLEGIYEELDNLGLADVKLQVKLKNYRDQALLSKKLALLDREAPIKVALEDLSAFQEVDLKKISGILSNLGFTSLIDRLHKL